MKSDNAGIERLAQELVRQRRQIKALGKPQLGNSSLEDAALQEYDADGVLVQRIGKQFDDTHLAASLNGPPPPTPTPPVVLGGYLGARVSWDGLWAADALTPMDFKCVEIHHGAAVGFDATTADTLSTTFTTERGGEKFIALPVGVHYIKLVAKSLSAKASAATASVEVTVLDAEALSGTTVFYGPTEPVGEVTGDLWLAEVAAGPPPKYETRRFTGSVWVAVADQGVSQALLEAAAAATLAGGKAKIFRQDAPPADPNSPAIWYDTNDGNRAWTWDDTANLWVDLRLGNGAIQPNSLVASDVVATGTVSAALLEALLVLTTEVVAGDPTGTHARLSPTGMRVFAEDLVDGIPNEVVRLGTDTNDILGISDANGELVAGIDQDGRVSGTALEVKGADTDSDGVPDAGAVIYGRDFSDWINDRAQGFIAIGSTGASDTFGPILAEYGLYELAAELDVARQYELQAGPIHVTGSQADTHADLQVRFTTDGSAPTITSPLLCSTRIGISRGEPATISGSGFVIAQGRFSTGSYRFLLTAKRSTGTGTIYVATTSIFPLYFSIKDMGRIAEANMVKNTGGGTFSGGGGSAAPPARLATYQRVYAATWARTFKGDGSIRTDVGGNEMVQGHQSTNGNQKAMLGGFLRASGTIDPLTDIAGSSIAKIELYLYANHWYQNSGGTAIFGTHGSASVPATFSTSGSLTVTKWPKPGGRWVTLPSAWHAAFLTGGNRGISIGPAPNTSGLYYGRFNGPGRGGDTVPLLRITYVK